MSSLQDLGRRVAALQDADREALRATELAGERFIRAVRQRPRRALPRALLVAAIVGFAAVVLFGWFGTPPWAGQPPLAVTPAVGVGDFIRAPADQSIPLRFSDGSEVLLSSGTEAIVRELSAEGARVDLARGAAKVSVQHRPQAQWSLHAGPYSIKVTGTRFDLAWTPESQRLKLDLREGAVRVSSEASDRAAVEMVAPVEP